MFKRVLFFVLLASSAFAQWDGFPRAADTNLIVWQDDTKHSVSQLWAALGERYQAIGMEPPNVVRDVVLPLGWATWVGTNDGVVFTNRSQLMITNSLTNVWGKFPWTYTDETGAHTVTGEIAFTTKDLAEWDYRLDAVLFGGLPTRFVAWSKAVSNRFENWFSTDDGAGNQPGDFPYETVPNLLQSLNIGRVRNTTTNEWGLITGGDWGFEYFPSGWTNWVIGEVIWNGSSWVRNGFWYNPPGGTLWSDVKPKVACVAAGTNWGPSSVYVSGVLGGGGYSNETVSIGTNADAGCVGQWWDLPTITPSGNGVSTGDSIRVVYRTSFPLWGDGSIAFGEYVAGNSMALTFAALDERQTAVNGLKATEDPRSALMTRGKSVISETNGTWAGAKSDAESKLAAAAWGSGGLIHRSYGTFGAFGPTYSARFEASLSSQRVSHVTNVFSKDVEVVFRGDGGSTFDDNGAGLTAGLYTSIKYVSMGYDTNILFKLLDYTNSFPNWCDQPTNAIPGTTKGHTLNSYFNVIHWAVTNGFKFQ